MERFYAAREASGQHNGASAEVLPVLLREVSTSDEENSIMMEHAGEPATDAGRWKNMNLTCAYEEFERLEKKNKEHLEKVNSRKGIDFRTVTSPHRPGARAGSSARFTTQPQYLYNYAREGPGSNWTAGARHMIQRSDSQPERELDRDVYEFMRQQYADRQLDADSEEPARAIADAQSPKTSTVEDEDSPRTPKASKKRKRATSRGRRAVTAGSSRRGTSDEASSSDSRLVRRSSRKRKRVQH